MNTFLFKEPKFFQLEFIKQTVKMIDAGCKFRTVHCPTSTIVVMYYDGELCAQSFIFYNNGQRK